jgi:aspartyl-tRNA synthetase
VEGDLQLRRPNHPAHDLPRCDGAYGIDRPDTRYDLRTTDLSELAARTDFKVFKDALAKGADRPRFNSKRGVVKAMRVPGGARQTHSQDHRRLQRLREGLRRRRRRRHQGTSRTTGELALDTGIAKFLEPLKAELVAALGLEPGDTVLFVADVYSVATKAIGELRQTGRTRHGPHSQARR